MKSMYGRSTASIFSPSVSSQLTSGAVSIQARSTSAATTIAANIQMYDIEAARDVAGAATDALTVISRLAASHVLRAERNLAYCPLDFLRNEGFDGEEQKVIGRDARTRRLHHQTFGRRSTQQHRVPVEFAAIDRKPGERVERVMLNHRDQSAFAGDAADVADQGAPCIRRDVMHHANDADEIE